MPWIHETPNIIHCVSLKHNRDLMFKVEENKAKPCNGCWRRCVWDMRDGRIVHTFRAAKGDSDE